MALDPDMASDTLGVLLKYQDDIERVRGSKVRQMIDDIRKDAPHQQSMPAV